VAWRRAVAALAVVAAASAGGWWLGEQRHDAAPRARVIEVIDGDTIVVAFANGSTDTIRLLGVDTPETC
jgi:endonuclease YncB( thermonuclease family)